MTSRHRVVVSGAILALGALIPTGAKAQTPTVPIHQAGPCGIKTEKPAQQLTTLYHAGDWTSFQTKARKLLKELDESKCSDATSSSRPRLEQDFTLLIWRGRPPIGEAALFTAVVPPSGYKGPVEPYALKLPGLAAKSSARLYQVFVADTPGDTIATVYMSTRQQNPLVEQIPAVVASIVDPLLALGSLAQGALRRQAVREAAVGWLTVARVVLPFERAGVELHIQALQPPTATTVIEGAKTLGDSLRLMDARYSPCAVGLSDAMVKVVDGGKITCASSAANQGGAACLMQLDTKLKQAYDDALKSCGTAESDLQALRLVDGKFREYLSNISDTKTPGKTDLKNAPLERYSFGVVTGLLFGSSSTRTRVTVNDDGIVVADPLKRVLAMVVVNGSFFKFDPTAHRVTRQERHRWFAGAVVAPSFGVGAGYSYLFVRGLAFNAGVVAIGITGAEDGQELGQPVNPEDLEDPYRLGVTYGWFLGASFNFK
jgi:hypothetical protein